MSAPANRRLCPPGVLIIKVSPSRKSDPVTATRCGLVLRAGDVGATVVISGVLGMAESCGADRAPHALGAASHTTTKLVVSQVRAVVIGILLPAGSRNQPALRTCCKIRPIRRAIVRPEVCNPLPLMGFLRVVRSADWVLNPRTTERGLVPKSAMSGGLGNQSALRSSPPYEPK